LSWNLKVKIYKTIILPVVLYGCETLSLTLREEHRLRVFENRVLRGIFGLKRDEVTGHWRKLHNGELHNLYSSPDIIRQIKPRRMRLAGHVAHIGEGRKVCRALVGNPEGKRPLERPRHRWEDEIKMDLREIGWGGVEWIHLTSVCRTHESPRGPRRGCTVGGGGSKNCFGSRTSPCSARAWKILSYIMTSA
jgi:hypothetical protein